MSRLTTENQGRLSPSPGDGWRERAYVPRRQESEGPSPGLLLTGLVVAGLGFLAWQYLGPDLKRYLKIRSM